MTPGKRENNPEKGRVNPEKGRIRGLQKIAGSHGWRGFQGIPRARAQKNKKKQV
jgi:hypothetical protein